jgi:hypothetical protein
MATLLKVLNNLADIKSAGGVALRVRTQGGSFKRPNLRIRACLQRRRIR